MDFKPVVVKTVHHRHPVAANTGPRIERTDTIQMAADGKTQEVNYWYENGRLIRVT